MSLKDKLKVKSNLRDQVEKESEGGKKDNRILNYYDLNFDEKLKVLFIPYGEGELWNRYKKHGPNMKVRGLQTIGCLNDDGGPGDCPICQVAYDYLDLWRETDDDSYKEEAKKWFPRDYMLMNVVVLDSPISISESDDGNQCKIFMVPRAIEKILTETIKEQKIPQDEIPLTPFYIKKTRNEGGQAAYSASYFDRKVIDDETIEALDEFMVEAYDLKTVDLVPPQPTDDELQEWIEKARKKLASKSNGGEEKEDDEPKKTSPRDRLNAKKKESEEKEKSDDSDSNETPDDSGDDEPEEKEEKSEAPTSIRDRLNRARNRA